MNWIDNNGEQQFGEFVIIQYGQFSIDIGAPNVKIEITATTSIPEFELIGVYEQVPFVSSALTINNKPLSENITLTAQDVNALSDTIKYGANLELSIDNTTYVVTAQLKDQDGNNIGTAQTIDLPLESVVINGSYDKINKKVILTLKNGSTVDFSVADLVSGLASQSALDITNTNVSELTIKVNNQDTIITNLSNNKVDKTTTINGKPLSGNIELNASDVGALPNTTQIPTVDSALSSTSTNPVQNKVIKTTLDTMYEVILSKASNSALETTNGNVSNVTQKAELALSKANSLETTVVGHTSSIKSLQDNKQSTLVSGTTIKTINGETLLGSGNIEIQASGDSITKSDLLDFIYPVGSIYMSVNNVSPQTFLGGTWSQITTDAYLKIVTSNAGVANGTSSAHKIPVSSMPSHNHSITPETHDHYIVSPNDTAGSGSYMAGRYNADRNDGYPSRSLTSGVKLTIGNKGDGGAYYPYYVGVYVWKRTA